MRDQTKPTCTWADRSACRDCGLDGRLLCRWDGGALLGFYVYFLPLMVTSWTGLALVGLAAGWWWPLIANALFYLLFFGFVEIRILCSHCPYYAREGLVLHCLANHGLVKLWRYRPGPMNRIENGLLLTGFLFLGLWPVVVPAAAAWRLAADPSGPGWLAAWALVFMALAALASALTFGFSLARHHCPRCVNFSCLLNRVPRALVDEYLRRNPVMRRAWEASGYRLENPEGRGID
ncbi:MAG: hypothetical protein KJ621_05220 [Proteobacteria bacterium]|nr:hypothetical protein [Pseudomonadota bacterium]MBU1743110.1 hypothetical protein [Pseudomonadota bacterium]